MEINGLEIVRAAIEDVNAQNDGTQQISTDENTQLFGASTGIDSLMLVNLFAAIEQQIENQTGQIIIIVDETALSDESHPFQSVGSLAQYVEKVVGSSIQ